MALSMREAFEATHKPQHDIQFDEASGLYFGGSNITALTMLNLQWDCWQKAWAMSRLNLVVDYPASGTLLSPDFNAAIHQCREAVEAACGHPRSIMMNNATGCTHQNQHTEGAGVRWCSDCGKKEPTPVISPDQATFSEKQKQANRIEGQFDTLKDRVVAAGFSNTYSDEEIAEMRTDMAVLSSQYFDLTGLTLK